MSFGADPLDQLPSFARGQFLAARAAGTTFSPEGIERLAEQLAAREVKDGAARSPAASVANLAELWAQFESLPGDSLAAIAERWAKDDAPIRIDDRMDLHWSWLPELFEGEPAALIVFALREVRADLAKETLRAHWSRLRSVPASDLEVAEMSPELASFLRVRLFSNFVLLVDKKRNGPLTGLLTLGKKEMHLLVYDLGLQEISIAGGREGSPELAQLLEKYDGAESTRLLRIFRKGQTPPVGYVAPEPDTPEAAREERRAQEAADNVRAAFEAAGNEGDLVSFLGLRRLATALSADPRDYCRYLGQKMQRAQALQLVAWRDALAAEPAGEDTLTARTELAAEIVRRLGSIVLRTNVPTVTSRVWA